MILGLDQMFDVSSACSTSYTEFKGLCFELTKEKRCLNQTKLSLPSLKARDAFLYSESIASCMFVDHLQV